MKGCPFRQPLLNTATAICELVRLCLYGRIWRCIFIVVSFLVRIGIKCRLRSSVGAPGVEGGVSSNLLESSNSRPCSNSSILRCRYISAKMEAWSMVPPYAGRLAPIPNASPVRFLSRFYQAQFLHWQDHFSVHTLLP